MSDTSLPPDYIALLEKLARAFGVYHQQTGSTCVLVGGAAAAIHTAGAFMSGDLDIIAVKNDEAFDRAMLTAGFVREERPGRMPRGYYHPEHVRYGVELVSGQLFDGLSDWTKLVRLTFSAGDALVLASPEDLIADRLGQHAIASPSDNSRLLQAQAIYDLAQHLDMGYLRRRVQEDGGDLGLLRLREGER